jgi:GlpG protein
MPSAATVRALALTADENIAPLSGYLWQQRIPHRIYEERGEQIVEVESQEAAARVRELYRAWRAGEFTLVAAPVQTATTARPRWALLNYPYVVAVMLLTVLCYPVTWPLDRDQLGTLLPWLTIVPVAIEHGALSAGSLYDSLAAGQFWRLFTPVLLHFGFAHLAFNIALFVEFGRRLERALGGVALVAVMLVIAGVSNAVQVLVSATALFGGLSGVVYGLFGFVIVRARLEPARAEWRVSPAFVVMIFGFLVLMSSGVTESFGLNIANGAHWSGLISGMLLAMIPVGRRGRDG